PPPALVIIERPELIARLAEVSLATLIGESRASTRLRNVIRRNGLFQSHTVADLLSGRLTEKRLLAVPEFGRTTLLELRSLAKERAMDLELTIGPSPPPDVDPVETEVPSALEGLTVADLADLEGFPVRIANRIPTES